MTERPLLVVVPARGGSKGLPAKNLAEVGGVPLVARAVRTGQRALGALGGTGRVVCSTDDPAIATVARDWGGEVPSLRPAELATDESRSLDVVRHAIQTLGMETATVVLLQPTSPFTEVEDVVGAVRLHQATGSPVISVTRAEHPVEWLFSLDDSGVLVPLHKGETPSRRQSSRDCVRPNGAVFVAAAKSILGGGGFLQADSRAYEMPSERSADVDSANDLAAARALAASRPAVTVFVGGHPVGPGHPCFVIAEAGVNHNGDIELAKRLVDAAANAGADAVKFQTFKAEKVVSAEAPQAQYQRINTGKDESQLEMVRRLELTADQYRLLAERCSARGIMFLSSPFDRESADLLVELGVPALKVGSGELTNQLLLSYLAGRGRPLVMSTGMASLGEVKDALDLVAANGAPPLVLLHCVSNYPVIPEDCNLAAMATLRQAFGVPVGWSDHTMGIHIAVAAAALGASVVEKHFTLDRSLPGPDHCASLEPGELAEMVRCIRDVEAARGTGVKQRRASEDDTARVARRSLFAVRDLVRGQTLRGDDVCALRPGTGLSPGRLTELVGRKVARPVAAGSMLAEEDLE